MIKYFCPICGKWYEVNIHDCPVMGESIGLANGKVYAKKENK